MRISVVDLDPAAPGAAVECELDDLDFGPQARRVLWVPVPSGQDVTQLDNFLADEAPDHALRSDVAVLGLPPEVAQDFNSAVVGDVSSRVEGAPVYTIQHRADGALELTHRSGPTVPEIEADRQGFIAAIGRADVGTVVRRAGAELPPHETLHYEGPNGMHYSAFLRVGLALRSTAELDRVAFWLVPRFVGRRCFLVDHWALIALGYRLGGYLERLDLNGGPTVVEAISSYDESHARLTRRLQLAFPDAGGDELGIIISVNSTGALAARMVEAAIEAGFDDPSPAAICETPADGNLEIPAVARLEAAFARQPDGLCSDCETPDSIVLPIPHDTYLLPLAAYVQETQVRGPDAEKGRNFFTRYNGSGVASVHRDHSDKRHHAFYIDVGAILDHPAFLERLDEGLAGWPGRASQLILCPPDDVAVRLAGHVSERFGGVPVLPIDEGALMALGGDELEQVLAAEHVCIVDDVTITGSRQYGYRNQLIRTRRSHDRDGLFDMYAIVGVARPVNERTRMGIADISHHRRGDEHFLAVETVFLPNWNSSRCPWCVELDHLDDLDDDVKVDGYVATRIEQLLARDGLREDLFLPWSGADWSQASVDAEDAWDAADVGDAFHGRYFELNRESVFGDLQDAELMLSVAAAVQQLRNSTLTQGAWSEPRLDEVFRSPVAKILSPELYLSGRFYEPVLVAAFLRCVHRHDVRAPSREEALMEAVRQHLLRSASSDELRTEVLFAAARKVLPAPALDLDAIEPPAMPAIRHLAAQFHAAISART